MDLSNLPHIHVGLKTDHWPKADRQLVSQRVSHLFALNAGSRRAHQLALFPSSCEVSPPFDFLAHGGSQKFEEFHPVEAR